MTYYILLQILTGSADGSIHVLYSPATAVKGVTMAVTRTPKVRAIDDFGSVDAQHATIIAPHSLPMFKEDGAVGTGAGGRGTKRRREKERHDPQKTLKPSPLPPASTHVLTILTSVCSCDQCRLWLVRVVVDESVLPLPSTWFKVCCGTRCAIRMYVSLLRSVCSALTLHLFQPREALLKYATQDPGENTWTKAWAASQPKPVFDTRPESDEER